MKTLNPILIKVQYEVGKILRLIISIIIDLIGMSTYWAPGAGEVGDLLWAFISVFLLMLSYPKKYINSGLALFEELFPFTDIYPSGIVTWYSMYYGDSKYTFENFKFKHFPKNQIE